MIYVDREGEFSSVLIGNGTLEEALYSPELVTKQREYANDSEVSLLICQNLIRHKIINSCATLDALGLDAIPLIRLTSGIKGETPIDRASNLTSLLGFEGKAASLYFQEWRKLELRWKEPASHPIPPDWRTIPLRRSAIMNGKHVSNRHATHPVNAMLNYAYAVLSGRVKFAIICAGLEPNVGFLHAAQKPKQAPRCPFVLDLMEPLRPFIDAEILKFATSKPLDPRDFITVRKSPVFPFGCVRLAGGLAQKIAVMADKAITISPIKYLPEPFSLLTYQA